MRIHTLFAAAAAVLCATAVHGEHLHNHAHIHWDSRVAQDSRSGSDAHPVATMVLSNNKIEDTEDGQHLETHTSVIRTVALPISFEAAEHATAADLDSLTQVWQQDGADHSSITAHQLPAVAIEHPDGGVSDAMATTFHFRGVPHVSSLTEANKATVHGIAVAISTPIVGMNQAARKDSKIAALNEYLASFRRKSSPQPVRMGCAGTASIFSSGDWVSVEKSDMQYLTPASVKDAFGLKKLSAWAFIAYASVVSGLFLASALWMGFVLTRSLLHMLCGAFMQREFSPVGPETGSDDETTLLVFKDVGKQSLDMKKAGHS